MTETEPIDAANQEGSGRCPLDPWDELQYDHRGTRTSHSPHELWRRLREERPVIHSDKYDGFWFVSRYEDVRTVLRDWRSFTSTDGIALPSHAIVMLPGEVDPPLHQQYRALINPLLTKEAIAEHEPWVREMAREWIAKLPENTEFNLTTDFCQPFAKRVALRVIGYPEEDLAALDHWGTLVAHGARSDEEGQQAYAEFFKLFTQALSRRAEEGPAPNLISSLVFGEIDGRRLTDSEQQSMLLEITFGGLDTTSAVLAGALVWLAGHPVDRARLRAEPDLWETAVEEFVRYVTPVSSMARAATKEVKLGGCPVGKGDKILVGYGSANRDTSAFDKPDDVVLDRSPNPHVGFGFGPHRCAGSNLGVLGVRIGLQEFLAAFEHFEVTDYYALRWSQGESRGLQEAPMTARRA
ncbi:cytochrome P450 [Pseudonocardia sp. NPDC046786]|uniref:cytochrome P450 n=1 Tax=Pseudonocardia sp. NPDC046786 TaxID=3155471 RepID=UPI0033D7A36C